MCHKRANSASALRPRGMTLNVLLMYLRGKERVECESHSPHRPFALEGKECVECESHSPHRPFALNEHSTRDVDEQI